VLAGKFCIAGSNHWSEQPAPVYCFLGRSHLPSSADTASAVPDRSELAKDTARLACASTDRATPAWLLLSDSAADVTACAVELAVDVSDEAHVLRAEVVACSNTDRDNTCRQRAFEHQQEPMFTTKCLGRMQATLSRKLHCGFPMEGGSVTFKPMQHPVPNPPVRVFAATLMLKPVLLPPPCLLHPPALLLTPLLQSWRPHGCAPPLPPAPAVKCRPARSPATCQSNGHGDDLKLKGQRLYSLMEHERA
jgi:hypothetical protein